MKGNIPVRSELFRYTVVARLGTFHEHLKFEFVLKKVNSISLQKALHLEKEMNTNRKAAHTRAHAHENNILERTCNMQIFPPSQHDVHKRIYYKN